MGVTRAIVIGGGPAGAACAAALAEHGSTEVTLLESRAFPRRKVCGEFISPAATHVLEWLIPAAELRAAGARTTRTVAFDGARPVEWSMPRPAWTLSRWTLDPLAAEAARTRGASVRVRTPVRDVFYEADEVRVHTDGGVLAADVVVHADGLGRFDPAPNTAYAPKLVGLKTQLRAPAASLGEGVRMSGGDGGYAGRVAVEDGFATVALVASKAALARHGNDRDALLASMWRGYDPEFRRAAGERGEWSACGVPRGGYRPGGHPRSFRVGNAAAAVDPVGGEGIGLALWSGQTLGGLLAESASLAEARARYARAYRARLRTRRPACRLAAAALSSPGLYRAATGALSLPGARSAILKPWAVLTGKPAGTG